MKKKVELLEKQVTELTNKVEAMETDKVEKLLETDMFLPSKLSHLSPKNKTNQLVLHSSRVSQNILDL